MEWESPGIVLSVRPFGEGDAVAATMTEAEGRHLGLARGGTSRRHAALWQPGNLLHLRWVGRLSDQLGSFTAELAHPAAALAMDTPLALAILNAAVTVADAALPERAPHPRAFASLLQVLAALADPPAALALLIRWEATLLAELGYGLDLTRCALTGTTADLAFVSPRTGRAVAAAAAAPWADRLLPLPAFLLTETGVPSATDLRDGLRLTAHFLARDAFGAHNKPLPTPRQTVYDQAVRVMFQEPDHA